MMSRVILDAVLANTAKYRRDFLGICSGATDAEQNNLKLEMRGKV